MESNFRKAARTMGHRSSFNDGWLHFALYRTMNFQYKFLLTAPSRRRRNYAKTEDTQQRQEEAEYTMYIFVYDIYKGYKGGIENTKKKNVAAHFHNFVERYPILIYVKNISNDSPTLHTHIAERVCVCVCVYSTCLYVFLIISCCWRCWLLWRRRRRVFWLVQLKSFFFFFFF